MQVSKNTETLINTYNEYLNKLHLIKPLLQKNTSYKNSYYPVAFNSEKLLLNCMAKLNSFKISVSRDFQILSSLKENGDLIEEKNQTDYLNKILCLPLDSNIRLDKITFICAVIQYETMLFQE